MKLTKKQTAELMLDKTRLDWLADKNNYVGNVQLPTTCVEAHMDSLRDAIDSAMKLKNQSSSS